MTKNKFIIMLIDGRCFEQVAPTKQIALQSLFKSLEYEDYDDFFADLNYVEWLEGGSRFLQNFVTATLQTFENQHYFLKSFLNINFNEPDEHLPDPTIFGFIPE